MPRPKHAIDIEITAHVAPGITQPWIGRIARKALALEKVESPQEVGILITNDSQVRRLNKKYRKKDATTDVLSFGLSESGDDSFPIPDGFSALGQVVVSYPQAQRQALDFNHSIKREVAFLIIHGLLHLLGYDHQKAVDERKMRRRQEAILSSLRITRS